MKDFFFSLRVQLADARLFNESYSIVCRLFFDSKGRRETLHVIQPVRYSAALEFLKKSNFIHLACNRPKFC